MAWPVRLTERVVPTTCDRGGSSEGQRCGLMSDDQTQQAGAGRRSGPMERHPALQSWQSVPSG